MLWYQIGVFKQNFPAFFMKCLIGPWGTWCCQLEGAWRIHESEKYCNNWTWKIWDWDMVFLPISTRVQWHYKALFLWVLSQLHEAQRTTPETYGEMCSKSCLVMFMNGIRLGQYVCKENVELLFGLTSSLMSDGCIFHWLMWELLVVLEHLGKWFYLSPIWI